MNNITEYNQLTGGLNIRLIDTLINTSPQATEFAYLENLTTYQSGGLTTMNGITKLLSSIADATPVIAMAQYSSETQNMIVYQKASGAIRFLPITGGAEPAPVATGITAPCQFVQFTNRIVGVNGVDQPFTCTPTTYAVVTTPHPDWSNISIGQPNRVTIHNNTRVVMTRKNNIYISALGNPNDWTTANDAFALAGAFGDFTDIRAISNYGEVTAFHSASNSIKLLTGTAPDEYQITPIEAPQSCQAPSGLTNANRANWYVSNRGIYALSVNEFGKIFFERDTELSNKIRPIFQNESTPYGNITSLSDALLISNPNRNELVFIPKMNNESTYAGMFIYSFDSNAWEYKKTIPLNEACYAHGAIYIADGRTGSPATGQLYRDGVTVSLEDSTPFIKRFSTGFNTFGTPFNYKKITKVYLRFITTSNATLTFNFYTDNTNEIIETRSIELTGSGNVYGTAIYGTSVYAEGGYTQTEFPLHFRFKSLKMEMICNDPIVDFKLLGLGIELEKGDAR